MEGFFLGLDQTFDQGNLVLQIRIVGFHVVSDDLDQSVHEGAFDAKLDAVANSPAQNTSEYIAAAGIGEHGTVSDRKRNGSDMVGDDPVRHLVFRFVIAVNRHLFGCVDDRQEQIGVKVGFTVLDQAGQTLETHTGIDVLLRQFLVFAARDFTRTAVILREDDIPDFDITVVFNIFKEELFP